MENTLMTTTELVVAIDIVLGESWMPAQKQAFWVPNLMEHKGEPYEVFWDSRVHNHHELLLKRMVHRTPIEAYKQQVSLHKALFSILVS